jgi:succinate dehydrogenase flavin-adding protein (antitoxin of CptAB toxin-antitoxin module)
LPENQALYKKAAFLSAKRALPENEFILSSFFSKIGITYGDEDIALYVKLIDDIDDLTLYDLITKNSTLENVPKNLQKIVLDIREFIDKAKNIAKEIKNLKM